MELTLTHVINNFPMAIVVDSKRVQENIDMPPKHTASDLYILG